MKRNYPKFIRNNLYSCLVLLLHPYLEICQLCGFTFYIRIIIDFSKNSLECEIFQFISLLQFNNGICNLVFRIEKIIPPKLYRLNQVSTDNHKVSLFITRNISPQNNFMVFPDGQIIQKQKMNTNALAFMSLGSIGTQYLHYIDEFL